MPGLRWDTDLITRLTRGTGAAHDVDEALLGLVALLRDPYSLWRASILMVMPDRVRARLVAVWSGASQSLLEVGTEMAISATTALPQVMRTGRPIVTRSRDGSNLLEDILREEGVRSRISIPLRVNDEVVGILIFASSSPEVFDASDVPFFIGVGVGLERRLLNLVAKSERL